MSAKVVNIRELSSEQTKQRISELLDKLELIGYSEDARTIKNAIPLWVELTMLRGKQLEHLELRFAEITEQQIDNEKHIMELESIPMMENAARAFIAHKGLGAEFELFIDAEVEQVFKLHIVKGTGGSHDVH